MEWRVFLLTQCCHIIAIFVLFMFGLFIPDLLLLLLLGCLFGFVYLAPGSFVFGGHSLLLVLVKLLDLIQTWSCWRLVAISSHHAALLPRSSCILHFPVSLSQLIVGHFLIGRIRHHHHWSPITHTLRRRFAFSLLCTKASTSVKVHVLFLKFFLAFVTFDRFTVANIEVGVGQGPTT